MTGWLALTNFKWDFMVFIHVYLYHGNSGSSVAGAVWLNGRADRFV